MVTSEMKFNQVNVFYNTDKNKPQNTNARIEDKERHVVSTRPAKSKYPQEERNAVQS